MRRKIEEWAERLFRNSQPRGGGCLEWTGTVNDDGYGIFTFGAIERHTITAHKAAYLVAVGGVPDGMVVKHSCRNRRCINPDHLEVATQKENIADRETDGTAHLRGGRGFGTRDERLAALRAGIPARRFAKQFGINLNSAYQWIRRNAPARSNIAHAGRVPNVALSDELARLDIMRFSPNSKNSKPKKRNNRKG
jgi:HNH endonuclease